MKHVASVAAMLVTLGACRAEMRAGADKAPPPPVGSPKAIPDAPVSGKIHGAPFVLRDARYVVDRRVGYEHTDIQLSAGKAESPCAPIEPANAPSVWLRLAGPERLQAQELSLGGDANGAWSVHYQVVDDEMWRGVGEGNALVSLLDPSPDGRLAGGLAVCFADDSRSCVMGSFNATSCPQRIDEPVRGAVAPEVLKQEKH
jgi:hypothetical protein